MIQENILRAIEEEFCPSDAGFYTYHDPGQDKYYGFFIDEISKVWMLSKPYATERNCENALQRFRDGHFLADVKEGGGGLFYTEFRSEAGQVLAWSPEFIDRVDAEQAEGRLKGIQSQQEGSAAEAMEPEITERTPPRHSFRLDFYRGGPQTPIRGRIEYSLTQESVAFQGLDMNLVRSFVARRLDNIEGPEGVAGVSSGEIRILEHGQPASQAVFSTETPLEVSLEIDIPEGEGYNAFVYAKSLGDHRELLIGRKQGASGPVRVPVFTRGLGSGLYRFTATVHLEGASREGQPADYSLSSVLFHLFSETEAGVEIS